MFAADGPHGACLDLGIKLSVPSDAPTTLMHNHALADIPEDDNGLDVLTHCPYSAQSRATRDFSLSGYFLDRASACAG